VPNFVNKTPQVATTTLEQRGFKVAQFAYDCGSSVLQGQVGYYSPTFAAPGTTVTICISSGSKPYIYTAPAPKPVTSSATPGAPVPPGTTPTAPH
jgi:hypothetical protein